MFCVLSRLWNEREAVLLNVDGVPSGIVAELQTILGLDNLAEKVPQAISPEQPGAVEGDAGWVMATRRLSILNNLKTRLQLKVSAEEERLKPELALVMRAGLKREDFRYTDDASEGEFNPDAFAGNLQCAFGPKLCANRD